LYSNFTYSVENTPSKPLIDIVKRAVEMHPLVQSAIARLDQASADANASSKPIYNPDLLLEYESNVDDISTIGISQTIDWSNKRQVLNQIGSQNKQAVKAELILIKQQVAASFLSKINQFQSSKLAYQLNSVQIANLDQFVDIAKRRFKSGDIGQVEVDLSYLVAGKIRMDSAKIKAQYFAAEIELSSFFNFKQINIPEISIDWIQQDKTPVEQLLLNHPRLKQLRLAADSAKIKIKLAQRRKSADPTISFNAGKEGKADLYRIDVAMPLFVRNTFSSEVDSAIANSVAVDELYRNTYRSALVAVKTSRQRLSLTLNAYNHWLKLSQSGLEQRRPLLQKLWKSGDLSTTNYLVQIQQTLDTQISATQLKADVIGAWIDYLQASGQIDNWLSLKSMDLN